jgi:hypothetical protein
MRWFRFYSEALDDPKVQRLPGDLFKAWVNLLCLANDGTPRGTLPSIEDIGFRLRLSPAKTRAIIDKLVDHGLLDEVDGNVTPHNWNDRQAKSDNVAERVQKHRAKQAEPVTRNVTVTPQNRIDKNRVDESRVEPIATDAHAPPPNVRAQDVHWDTQVEIFGFAPTPDTPEHGRWQRSTGIWRKLNASPDDMHHAAELYRQEFPNAAFTAVALAGRAEQLLRGHKPDVIPRIEDIKNPGIRALIETTPEDYDAIRREVQAKNGRSVGFPSEPRRLGDGGRPPQQDVLPPPVRTQRG